MADHRNTGAVALKDSTPAALAVLVSATVQRAAVEAQPAQQTALRAAGREAIPKNL